jgi:hypothetical protein
VWIWEEMEDDNFETMLYCRSMKGMSNVSFGTLRRITGQCEL